MEILEKIEEGKEKRNNEKKKKLEKTKVEVVATKAFTYCCSFF